MAKIAHHIEIARPSAAVFSYLDQLERRGEWQAQILRSKRDTPGPTHVGTRITDVRRAPGGLQTVTYVITEYVPPERLAYEGVEGRVRPSGSVTIEPLGPSRSLVTIELTFVGSGVLGAITAPIARRQARNVAAADLRRLRALLELTARADR